VEAMTRNRAKESQKKKSLALIFNIAQRVKLKTQVLLDMSLIGRVEVPEVLRLRNDLIFGVKQPKFLVITGIANYTYRLPAECNS
jgi:hypothetical protein